MNLPSVHARVIKSYISIHRQKLINVDDNLHGYCDLKLDFLPHDGSFRIDRLIADFHLTDHLSNPGAFHLFSKSNEHREPRRFPFTMLNYNFLNVPF